MCQICSKCFRYIQSSNPHHGPVMSGSLLKGRNKIMENLNILHTDSQQVAELGFDPDCLAPEPMSLLGDSSQT